MSFIEGKSTQQARENLQQQLQQQLGQVRPVTTPLQSQSQNQPPLTVTNNIITPTVPVNPIQAPTAPQQQQKKGLSLTVSSNILYLK